MSTRLLLEGTDLAELMIHVRSEFGPTARIVRAERVRSGGVAGFFSRERYELTVDVPDAPSAQTVDQRPRALRNPSGGIEALLAAADAGDGDGLAPSGPVAVPTAVDAAPGGTELAVLPPRVSTGERAFVSVLEQVRAMTGSGRPAELPVADGAPAARVFQPLAPTVVGAAADDVPVVLTQVAAPVPGPGRSRELAPPPPTDPQVSSSAGVPREQLIEIGLPAALLASVPGDGPVPLGRVLASVPAAPALPRDPGSVVVVVGGAADAVRVAGLMAERLKQPAGTVVYAGRIESAGGHGRRLTTAASAERWRARSAELDHVAVVALGAGPGADDTVVGAELLAALRPDAAWAVVDARSKPRDCRRWIESVGGGRGIDALAVHGLFETAEPGTVLGLGVPVAWVDGVPATRIAWAAALSMSLPEGTDWD